MMITPRPRTLVCCVAALAGTLALGACAGTPSRAAWRETAAPSGPPLTVRFDNEGRGHVHVYLIGEQREWLLGRVEPGARATLRIPPASLAGTPGFVRLAVLAGERLTPQAARDARASFSIAQPTSAISSQRWTFSQGQLTPLQLSGARTGAGSP